METTLKFLTPKNLDEALRLVSKHPNYNILAGGTDICVQMNGGFIRPEGLINIWGLDELRKISESGDFVEVGALTTHTEIINSPLVKNHLPALAEACMSIGGRQIQNRGTIGGNVMNASPAGDTMPVLLAYDAEVEAASMKGRRWIRFQGFYEGYRKTALAAGEIVTRFKIPKAASGERSAFLKIGTRKALAISKVMGCFRINVGEGLRPLLEVQSAAIAFGSVAPTPVRLPKAEKFLVGKKLTEDVVEKLCEIAVSEVQPIDDIRSTALYRSRISGILLKRFLMGL